MIIAVGFILFVMLMNLRGVKESGTAFAIPTYFFVILMFIAVGTGIFRLFVTGTLGTVIDPPEFEVLHGLSTITPFLILHAFASGTTALTGVAGVAVPVVISVNGRKIALVSAALTFGPRWFFQCPKCGRPVEAVYVLRGGAACRRCHRLLYRSQCHRSTSAYRVLGRLLAANGRENVNEPLLRGLVDALRAVMVREPVRMSLAEKGGGDAAE